MLKLININKSFKCGKEKRIVLNNINVSFKEKEMVFILGRSGSGKSTLLNIIGGILKSDNGEIYFDNNLISKFSERKLNNYRNKIVGFIFQDYNLVEYMSVSDNIKLAQTINNNKNRMNLLLKQLNIYDKKNIIVNKLSGGEKQRVAIARALINDPKIVLCDEPTGALDYENGIRIMDVLKKISNNKLVIVVSHDNFLANKYADRIINISDGNIDNHNVIDDNSFCKIKRGHVNIFSVMKIAFKNLLLKKWRTLFTSIAISLGIISMMLVVNLSSCFKKEIGLLEENITSIYPISISNGKYNINKDINKNSMDKIFIDNNKHINKIDKNYISYINNINLIDDITYEYDISMPLISSNFKYVSSDYFKVMPKIDNYNLLYGNYINSIYDIVLLVEDNNKVSKEILNYFNIDNDIDYEDIIGKKIRVILNDDYYVEDNNNYIISNNVKGLYNKSNIELTIVGVIKEKDTVVNNSYIYYDSELFNYIISKNRNSKIVNSQINNNNNVLDVNISKEEILSYLGYDPLPNKINIYVNNSYNKKMVIKELNKYHDIIYVDTLEDTISVIKNFISIISIVLIIFSFISIIVSSLMIFILTGTRVVERYKEIGIFRSLGCSKMDIINIFNFENFFIGVISSVISIINIHLLRNPINYIINQVDGFNNIFIINNNMLFFISIINIIIIIIFGCLPVIKASNKQIVDCIYNK